MINNSDFYDFDKYKNEALKDPEIKEIYDDMDFKYQLIKKSIDFRIENHLTQTDLAKKMGIKQQNISRFERGLIEPSTKFISKLLHIMNLKVKFEKIQY